MPNDNEDHRTAAELFAEWAKTQFDNQSGNIADQFFTTNTNETENTK